MSESSERRSREASGSAVPWFLAGLLALVILYALSPLPVCWIFFQSNFANNESAVEWLFRYLAPLSWLSERSTAVERFYDWYMSPLENL